MELDSKPSANTTYVYINSDGTVVTGQALTGDTVAAGEADDQTKFDGTKVYAKVSVTLNSDGAVTSYGFGD